MFIPLSGRRFFSPGPGRISPGRRLFLPGRGDRRNGFLPDLVASGGTFSKANLLRYLTSHFRIIRCDGRIFIGQSPFGLVVFDRHAESSGQMTLERFQMFAVFQADDVIGEYGFLDRNCGLLFFLDCPSNWRRRDFRCSVNGYGLFGLFRTLGSVTDCFGCHESDSARHWLLFRKRCIEPTHEFRELFGLHFRCREMGRHDLGRRIQTTENDVLVAAQ
ncbi:hypothetical protein GLX_22450 [Komagataeibacter medellinensis NBRC 3288]|uniref:Uncharacterized protein n=1 Tax=Komagataeibacter medellinensis (strain NBRC 3288 / BCRC 11682 / LMG 1693 / Kondo 51) TaxID=634177 RepID=G2I149_KOMMN|nr:hypothetical protein GLX_22450 [Komagataeibacter medellinensis NBRC 3288]